MRVILAQPRGFCAGVVRAIDIVEHALLKYGTPVYVRHEIVHNKHVVDSLHQKGARFVDDLTEVPRGAITIFSAHGVAKSVEDDAQARQLHVFDATCPLVIKVHNQARKYIAEGYQLILIGETEHPEVIGTIGQVNAPVTVVRNASDVDGLLFSADARLAYVTQTTLSIDDTRSVVHALQRRYPHIVGPDTRDICYAVQNRQTAVRELSRCVDVVLVVGAKNSANSVVMRSIASEAGVPSYLVADGSEVQVDWMRDVETVGVTAGASTPEVLVEDVLSALRRITKIEVEVMAGRQERAVFNLPAGLI
ncbi:4-hydroxy-3-methylbut-2-enyl diphosphate reductase [Glaciimonas immobilis]|uniref:4-hydroxy-3-methylbut-2-enyl diphosphate reductase n=1 Tax=Glaciimonas immobilis TaxID=728004 RepID=A0A840RMK3_9BURK|nr:4-hydroxy-3-methylbut-2-enyl diphosphate reductase [Glaciimonas immobilis]KAF3999476.1 4-hydroxy-3-methylbut-2-enyl diphosphate reductase [Glaciimonas immobilis]MBB5198993.1 4-hydroxy-3-methylbut-2-enyl diphosphate reductase [Glaciimonas immobilis]